MRVNFIVDMEKSLQGSGIYSSAKRLQHHLSEKGIKIEINGKDRHYDIYHFHTATPKSLLLAKLYQKRKSRLKITAKRDPWKLVAHGHTTVEDFQNSFFLSNQILPVVRNHLKTFYHLFDHIIAVSNHNKELIAQLGMNPSQISVISNGIDLKRITPWDLKKSRRMREKILKKFNLSADSLIIICVGIGFYRKGIDTFVDVGSQLPNQLFFWIGHQYPISFLTQQRILKKTRYIASELPNIRITGYVSRKTLDTLLNVADVFFYPTREENQGIALLEAMVFGKAPVVRDHPVFDWLIEGKDCLKGKTTQDFVHAIKRLASDEALLQKIQGEARRSVKKHDISTTINRLIELYESLLSE